jgi:hypothetical protein
VTYAVSITLHKLKPESTFARVCTGDSDAQKPEIHCQPTPEGVTMKTILMLTAVVLLAGCGDRRGTTSGADTTAAMSDTTMMHTDTAMTADTAAK